MTQPRAHLTHRECEHRYPRLIRAMKWVAVLSTGEAACAIRDHRDGFTDGGGEAVLHFAGRNRDAATYVVRRGIAVRHMVARLGR